MILSLRGLRSTEYILTNKDRSHLRAHFTRFFRGQRSTERSIHQYRFLSRFRVVIVFLYTRNFFFDYKVFVHRTTRCRSTLRQVSTTSALRLFVRNFIGNSPRLHTRIAPNRGVRFNDINSSTIRIRRCYFRRFFLSFNTTRTSAIFFDTALVSSFDYDSSS